LREISGRLEGATQVLHATGASGTAGAVARFSLLTSDIGAV